MLWHQKAILGAFSFAIGLGVVNAASAARQDRSESSPISSQPGDPLDAVLERAGMRRSELGWSPRGWWMRYPRTTPYKLDHVDDLYPVCGCHFRRSDVRDGMELHGDISLQLGDETMNLRERFYGFDATCLLISDHPDGSADVENRNGGTGHGVRIPQSYLRSLSPTLPGSTDRARS